MKKFLTPKKSDTPRTDAKVRERWIPPVIDCVPADFAREMERELNRSVPFWQCCCVALIAVNAGIFARELWIFVERHFS